MATINGSQYVDQTGTPVVPINPGEIRGFYAEHVIGSGSAAEGDADVVQLIDLPAGYVIVAGFCQWEDLASAGTLTGDLGTGTNPDGFLDGLTLTAAGQESFFTGVTGDAGGVLVSTSDDTIDLTFIGTTITYIAAAKFRFWALGMKVNVT